MEQDQKATSLLDEMIENLDKIPEQEQVKAEKTEATTVRQQVQDMAIALGVAPEQIKVKADLSQMLNNLKKGYIAELHISRPRGNVKIDEADNFGLVLSQQAQDVLKGYFRLGVRSLFPVEYQKRLALVESQARGTLTKYAFKSHWGYFLPASRFEAWQKENVGREAAFWALKEEMLAKYEEIKLKVIEDHRPLARDAWKNRMLTSSVSSDDDEGTNFDTLSGLLASLARTQDRQSFIENYLACIEAILPTREDIEEGFAYEIEWSFIPLPSMIARDMEIANEELRQQAIQDAETQAQLAKIRTEQSVEQQIAYDRLMRERRQQDEQDRMEKAILADANRQKERLITDFYRDVIGQINVMVEEVSGNVLESLEKNNGTLRGPVADSLRNLIVRLETANFIQDERIEDQIDRLRQVVPSDDTSPGSQRDLARRGLVSINTDAIARVVRTIHEESEKIIVELGIQPRSRRARSEDAALDMSAVVDLGERRQSRRTGLDFETTPEEQPTTTRKSRRAF